MARYRQRQQHDLTPLLRGKVGVPLDGPAAEALALWREELVADLGSDLSAQEATIVELVVRQRFLLDQVDGWLLAQNSIVNKRKRELFPIVKARQTLADGLARLLGQLGLQRRAQDAGTLADYVAQRVGDDE